MSAPQFVRASTRPLTARSYRVAIERAWSLLGEIDCYSTITDPSPVQRSRLTRAIRDLAMHAKRLDERHRASNGDGNARED